MVLSHSVKFIFLLFETLFDKSGTTVFQNVRLSAIFLMSKLFKQVILVFSNLSCTKISLRCISFPIEFLVFGTYFLVWIFSFESRFED